MNYIYDNYTNVKYKSCELQGWDGRNKIHPRPAWVNVKFVMIGAVRADEFSRDFPNGPMITAKTKGLKI